jgi:GcrA cell cycle regulator
MNQPMTVTDQDIARARAEKGWTSLRVNVALGLFARGLSDAEIAAEIGQVSRNAVIGMRSRKGVFVGYCTDRPPHRNANGVPAGEPKERRAERRALARAARPKQFKAGGSRPAPPSIDDAAIPLEQRRSLLDLTDNCCRWPVGEPQQPGFFFCGAYVHQPDPNRPRPYCRSHMRLSIDPSRGRLRNTPRADVHRGGGHVWR